LCGESALRGRVVVVVRGERGEGPEERETERDVWSITNFVRGHPKTSDADRAGMGIMVRDILPSTAPAPMTRPLGLVESGQRLRHQLRLENESTPTRCVRAAGT